jgi:hypothetical protein
MDDKPEDVAKSKLAETKAKAQEVKKHSDEFGKSAQQIDDLASAALDLIKLNPSNVDYETVIYRSEQINQQLDDEYKIMRDLNPSLYYTAASANTTMGTVMIMASFGPATPVEREKQDAAINRLRQVVDRLAKKEELIPIMQNFGLDHSYPGTRSPIDQLEIAWAAYLNPVTQNSPAQTSLVPMRECIEQTVLSLLERRPRTERASSWGSKIGSIAKQLSRDEISGSQIEFLVNDWESLEPLLSGSKRNTVTRESWQDIFRKANSFLLAFLLALDPQKMRTK